MKDNVNVFKEPWVVTYIRACDSSGAVTGYEVSVFRPLCDSLTDITSFYGYAKCLFVKDIRGLIVGDWVYLGFSKKYKCWYIKKRCVEVV